MSKDESIGCFAFLTGSAKKKAPAPPAQQAKLLAETRRVSQSFRSKSSSSESDSDFMMRVQGFDDEQIQAVKEEKIKRLSQDMEAKRKSQEEDFHLRLQG
jgi:hypothetical protein